MSDTPLLTVPAEGWRENALCQGKTHLFFGPPGERPSRRRRREQMAASYCAVCPVAGECRVEARLNNECGFWGGESEEERARAGYPPRSIERRSVAAAAREGEAERAAG